MAPRYFAVSTTGSESARELSVLVAFVAFLTDLDGFSFSHLDPIARILLTDLRRT